MNDRAGILASINALLDESAAGSMPEANARLDDILDPGPGQLLDPQHTLFRFTSALLGRLLAHSDYECWAEEDCDDTDGLLREIIRQATALRPRLVEGIPDPPASAETWARAGQLIETPSHAACDHDGGDCQVDPDDEEALAASSRAIRLLAATVQAFEDAGLSDGSHFVNMAAYVWGFSARDIHDPAGTASTVVYDGVDPAKLKP